MVLAVRLYGADNEKGLPEDWPREVIELREGQDVPNGFTVMSKEEYTEYLSQHKEAYDSTIRVKEIEEVRADRIRQLAVSAGDYVELHYGTRQQATLTALWTEALALRYTERSDYIGSALTWVKKVLLSYYEARDAALAARSVEELRAIRLDLESLSASDPLVTIEEAIKLNR